MNIVNVYIGWRSRFHNEQTVNLWTSWSFCSIVNFYALKEILSGYETFLTENIKHIKLALLSVVDCGMRGVWQWQIQDFPEGGANS